MGTQPMPLEQRSSTRFGKAFWAVAGACLVIGVLVVIIGFPGFIAVYELYWSRGNIQKLFYEDLGLSQSWSSFIAVAGSFFYGLAWVPLLVWTYRVLLWRFNAGQFTLAFVCWVFVYGHVPFLHAVLGTDTCFNQRTGEPTKWYVQDADGRIVLFDSGGFDAATGASKQPVTTQICAAFDRQKKNDKPRRITVDVHQVEFFDSATGRPRVWYSKLSNGQIELFDARGYHPITSEPLLVATKEVVTEIMKRLADEEASRTRAEEERRKAEAEALRRATEERAQADAAAQKRAEEARQKAEAEAQRRAQEDRKQAEASAAKRAEEERRQAAEARKRAEEERKQAEAETRKRAAEARKRAQEERKQAQVEAQRQAEDERQRREAAEQKRAEDQRTVNSYARTESGALCRNDIRNGEVSCECGHFRTMGPCRFR